jgi:signal transduction histidine kinase
VGEIYGRIEDLSVGDHACFIFKREEDWLAIVIPYILTGLARGERVCCVADFHSPEQILRQLKQKNSDMDVCLKKGQLIIISRGQCVKKSELIEKGLFSFIQGETEAALAEGYSALRIVSEMDWGHSQQNFEMRLEDLAKASDFVLHNRCLALCLFDRKHFRPEVLQSLLYIFPLVIIDTEIYDNYYYLPPEALLRPDLPELKLNLMMDSLKERKQFLQVLQESEAKFRGIVAERTEHLKNIERMATIGETAAMIGHDLRNPLQVLLCMVYLAKDEIKSGRLSGEGQKLSFEEILDSIEESADYMNKIVSDVQDYARPMKLDLVETEISYFLREALFTIIIPDNVRINVQIEDNMPRVLIDQEKMKRVIINLINNSLNAMLEGGLIEISVIHTKDRIKILIKDTGIGIPDENMPQIFKPLFTTRSKGVGLGLSVCKRMMDAMGGNISIKSEVGKGTEASVEIPTEQKDG